MVHPILQIRRLSLPYCLVAALWALATVPALANDIEGKARPVDGDSFNIEIRIFGIDTPEHDQTCVDAKGSQYGCGQVASDAMKALTEGKTVTCDKQDQDTKHGRPVAICYANGVDVGAYMVDHGLAVAYREYSDKYAANEERAKAAKIGLWAGSFQMPWCYRHNKTTPECFYGSAQNTKSMAFKSPDDDTEVCPATPRVTPSTDCVIKGNISDKGKIYHTPASSSYAKTVITPSKGERYFCSEEEAIACGWRHPRG